MGKRRSRKLRPFADKTHSEAPPVHGVPLLKKRTKLVLAVPAYGDSPADFWVCFVDLFKSLADKHPEFDIIVTNMAYIDFARNDIVRRAAEKGAKEVLFLDHDTLVPPDLYWRLAAHKVPVVSALYFKRLHPFEPLIYDFDDDTNINCHPKLDYPEGLVKCGAVGMGATLIQMDAIEAVLKWQIDNNERHPNPFRVFPPIGEDIFFCAHCREAGVDVFCDTTIKCLHVGSNPVSEAHFKLINRYGSMREAAARMEELEALPQPEPLVSA